MAEKEAGQAKSFKDRLPTIRFEAGVWVYVVYLIVFVILGVNEGRQNYRSGVFKTTRLGSAEHHRRCSFSLRTLYSISPLG